MNRHKSQSGLAENPGSVAPIRPPQPLPPSINILLIYYIRGRSEREHEGGWCEKELGSRKGEIDKEKPKGKEKTTPQMLMPKLYSKNFHLHLILIPSVTTILPIGYHFTF